MKLKPLGKKVLVHPIEDPSMTGSGLLFVPEQAKQRVDNGIVVAKGSLVSDEISIGDHVTFSGYSGEQITVEDAGRFFLIPESHLSAILTPESPVILIDTLTMIRVIQERFGELGQVGHPDIFEWHQIESSLIDRITDLTTSEGFLF